MKQTPLGPGQKALDRGSTFNKRGSELRRTGSTTKRRRGISPASPAQRAKARTEPCVVTGQEAIEGVVIHSAHLCPRGMGGCDDPLCTVPLRADVHRQFDDGQLCLLPHLVGRRTAEIQHALGHYGGDLIALLQRLTGERYVPETA